MIHLPTGPLAPSRRDTTLDRAAYLAQPGLFGPRRRPGERGFLREAFRLRVAEGAQDQAIVREVLTRRHYLAREMERRGRTRPFPPHTLLLHYLADLAGYERPGEAAGLVSVRIAPRNCHAIEACDLHPCAVLEVARTWRADDLVPEAVPHFTSHMVFQVVRRVRADWLRLKVARSPTLQADPRLLVTYADPAAGHDGATYRAAGAADLGHGAGGKLLFGWGLVPEVSETLRRWSWAA